MSAWCEYNVAVGSSRASQDACRWSGAIFVTVDGVNDLDLTTDMQACVVLESRRCQDSQTIRNLENVPPF